MVCRYIKLVLVGLTGLFLLLANLGVEMGGFSSYVLAYWPAVLIIYAVLGFCPCGCCCKTEQ